MVKMSPYVTELFTDTGLGYCTLLKRGVRYSYQRMWRCSRFDKGDIRARCWREDTDRPTYEQLLNFIVRSVALVDKNVIRT